MKKRAKQHETTLQDLQGELIVSKEETADTRVEMDRVGELLTSTMQVCYVICTLALMPCTSCMPPLCFVVFGL